MKTQLPIMTRAASFDAATVDTKNRTVQVIWSTGATVVRGGFFTNPYNEELSMDPESIRMERLNSGAAPLTNSHNTYDLSGVIGVVEPGTASVSNGIGRATVRFSKRADVEPIWQDVQDRIIRNVSVGAIIHRAKNVSKATDAMKTIRAVDWEPREIALCPVGADAGAVIRGEAQTHFCELDDSQETAARAELRPDPATIRQQLELLTLL